MHGGDKNDAVKVSKDECEQESSYEVGIVYEITPIFFTSEGDPGVDKFIKYRKNFFEKNFSKL